MSIDTKLTRFAQQELVIGYNSPERDRIKSSLIQLENVLTKALGKELSRIIKFGSYTRNTILPRAQDPNSDVDLLIVFNTDDPQLLPNTYREKILRVITSAYPSSKLKKDFPVIKLELANITFDLVPTYITEGWVGNNYYIPDSGGGWRPTNPNDINENLSKMNQSYGENIVRNVIRLCKHWNFSANYPFRSYILEKEIVEMFFWWGDDLYEKFRSVLWNIAGDMPRVNQALEYLEMYKNREDEKMQIKWMQKLLPNFHH